MYSYEDRIRAVRLYMKLGKRTGATIHELEYLLRESSNKNFGYPFCIEQQLPEDCSVIGFSGLTIG